MRSTKNSNLLAIGHAFIELQSVDSTNNYAMAQASKGRAAHGTLFFAHEQWAGKGQRGRSWTSTPGENIVLSAVLEPLALQPSQAFSLSVCVALACHDLFSRYAGPGSTSIKWPNDLYWNDRKAGGILIENHFQGDRWPLAIAGMGININQVEFSATARNPVSLRQITGRTFQAAELARELGSCLDQRYSALIGTAIATASGIPTSTSATASDNPTTTTATTSDNPVSTTATASGNPTSGNAGTAISKNIAAQLQEYNSLLYRQGQTVRLKKDNAVFETVIQGVSAHGQLLTRDVMDREFNFGEVEWLIPESLRL
ncbi:MAG TPA: biotin--[acetyl-CoA-carboxylase] ligase [Puia sp.]|nr:biotin--[acetyl-CoA-carboxylase] ligase [Puia sp.]